MRRILVLFMLLSFSAAAQADVKVSKLFSDNLVLQRDSAAPVWGTAEPGEKVAVKIGDVQAETAADSNGKWQVKLTGLKTNATPQDMTISGKNTLTVKNVLIGDVWVCSGQSNMEMTLGSCNAPDDVAQANFPLIRRIKFDHRAQATPTTEVPHPWETCSPQTAGNFTAAGFYFARRILQETGIPIGLIDNSWGGSNIESYIPPCGLKLEPSLAPQLKSYEATLASNPNALNGDGNYCAKYNGIVYPVVPYGIKGVLWYQGESNGGEGNEYLAKMKALIGGWREVWAQGDFPFYYVQLASFQAANDNPAGGDGWARHRMAQSQALSIPHTGMALAIDVGDAVDIHPKDKFDLGERLARWALHNEYGKSDVVVSGPLYKGIKVEGDKVRVEFDYTGGGLMVGKKDGVKPTEEVKDGTLKRFAVAGEDKQWKWADAKINGATVVVSSPDVPKPVAVRYAYSMNPQGANLYNREGLPASPFRSDDW